MKFYPLIQRTDLVKGTCPECDKHFAFEDMTIDEVNGATTDCKCGALLIIEDGKVYEFHKKINSEDERWSVDGKNTGFIEL